MMASSNEALAARRPEEVNMEDTEGDATDECGSRTYDNLGNNTIILSLDINCSLVGFLR